MKSFITIWFLYFVVLQSMAQTGHLESLVTLHFNQVPARQVLSEITNQTGLTFSYSPDAIEVEKPVTCHIDQKPLRYALYLIFGIEVNVKQRGKHILLIKNKPGDLNDKLYIEGYITEPLTGKGLNEVTIYNKDLKASAITNRNGYFKIELKPLQPITELRVCKSGFTDTTLVEPLKTGFVDIRLQAADTAQKPNLMQKWAPNFPVWLVSREMLVNAINIKGDSIFEKVQVSFVPFVSTNQLLGGNAVNDFSLNVIAGYTQSVRILEVGGAFNFVKSDAGYCQLAGFGNLVGGTSRGVQAAGFYNISRENKGIQMAGFFNTGVFDGGIAQLAGFGNFTWGKIDGIQAAGYFNIAREVKGIQVAGFFNYTQKLIGAQVAGFSNYASQVNGPQVAGGLNIGKDYCNTQISGFMNLADTSEFIQVAGFANYAKQVNGVQVAGFLNIAHRVDGVQVGVVNWADTCPGISIGLISFVNKGYRGLEFSTDEMMHVGLTYRMGVDHFYNIFSLGYHFSDNKLAGAGWGFGTLLGHGPKRRINLEMMQFIYDDVESIKAESRISRFYCGISRSITNRVSFNYGLTFNVFESDETNSNKKEMLEKSIPYSVLPASNDTKMWIGARLGLRF